MGNMEDIMNTLKSSTQTQQLISSFANFPKDLEGTHETLTKFALTGKVKVPGAQQNLVPNRMHLLPVMCIIEALLIALGSPHVLLGIMHKLGNIGSKGGSKGGSFLVGAFNTNNKVKWRLQWLPIHQLSR